MASVEDVLMQAGHPVTLAELQTRLGGRQLDLEQVARFPSRLVGTTQLLWHPSVVASPSAGATLPIRRPGTKRDRAPDAQAARLAELLSKKALVDKHAGAGTEGAEALDALAERWREAGVAAFEDVHRMSNSTKSLRALARDLDVDANILGLESDGDDEEHSC